ncbi:squalene/phytoene synthase family protein [Rhodopseudomonas boonkerdii]|uniref:phytoene/squalene synthase family protein n=1 Tax=Rhodopseudomonas boonkerdii TaxID=475937 RepID=UPI001E51E484|nr:phytoene/squalene synthase family protein [Rhodopseudomonas boonkerdii]UGV26839.1 squalene/phytoene synthase family protein [Rhodopseudomonas boonkerdii]
MSGADTSAAVFCADLVRTHDFDRYASTLFVPADKRRPLLALYGFNAEVSRVRDQVRQALPGEIRLQWWTDALAGAGHGDVEQNPVAAELLRTVRDFDLPVDRLAKLIDAHVFDLYNDPMPDLAVLESHFRDTSGTLFACAGRILGDRSEAVDHAAEHLGLAHGVTRIAARLPYDAARRQLYLPHDMLRQNGGSEHEFYAGKLTPAIRATLDQLIKGAQEQLAVAGSMLADVAEPARAAFLPIALVKYDLGQMADARFDPFELYIRSRLRTLWTLWRAS